MQSLFAGAMPIRHSSPRSPSFRAAWPTVKLRSKEPPKIFTSVAEMVRELSDENSRSDEIEAHLSDRRIAHFLFGLRCARGVSQKQIADRFGCSQSRISKFENSADEDLRLGDVKKYLEALGLDLRLVLSKQNWTAMDEVKFHAVQIHRCLRLMSRLAERDEQIAQGVTGAHIETLVNLVKIVIDSAQTLPNVKGHIPQIVEAESANGDSGERRDSTSELQDAVTPA